MLIYYPMIKCSDADTVLYTVIIILITTIVPCYNILNLAYWGVPWPQYSAPTSA